MTQKKQVVLPNYYPGFRCIGTACSDNCCHGWPIEIDKAHYLQYKAEKNAAFMSLCAQNVHRIKKDSSPQRYARLSLDPQGRCGFQDEDGGCRIIRLLGEDALSITCATYPRRKVEFTPGLWEFSLSMSCEEAVRISVLAPSEITFQTVEQTFSEYDPVYAMDPVGIGAKGRIAAPPFWGSTLRRVCINLMQTREFAIPERILAILLLLRRLDKLTCTGQESQIPAETIRFLQAVEQGSLTGFFENLDYSQDAHLAALQIPMGHLIAGRQEAVSRDFLIQLESYLEIDSSGNLCAGKKAQTALLGQICEAGDPLMAQHSQWIENYFVNYLFSAVFPFLYRSEGLNFEDHAILLLHQYGILRCLIATASAERGDEKFFTQAFVHTARLSQHGDFAVNARKLVQSLGIGGAAHLIYLLR